MQQPPIVKFRYPIAGWEIAVIGLRIVLTSLGEGTMQDPSSKAERYRKEAAKYHELAKFARPAYLGDFYRQVAVRYMFMAQDVSRQPERRGGAVSDRGR